MEQTTSRQWDVNGPKSGDASRKRLKQIRLARYGKQSVMFCRTTGTYALIKRVLAVVESMRDKDMLRTPIRGISRELTKWPFWLPDSCQNFSLQYDFSIGRDSQGNIDSLDNF
jgi:hypothetical protein